MRVNRSRTVNLTQLPLHLREAAAHVRRLPIWQRFKRSLIDRSSCWQAKVGSRFRDIDGEHFKLVGILNSRRGSVVDTHGALGKTVIFFQLGVHKEERLAVFLRAVFQSLFEKVSCSFELFTAVSLDKFGQVNVPDFEGDREVEQLDTSFVYLRNE